MSCSVQVNEELTAEEWKKRYEKKKGECEKLKAALSKAEAELARWVTSLNHEMRYLNVHTNTAFRVQRPLISSEKKIVSRWRHGESVPEEERLSASAAGGDVMESSVIDESVSKNATTGATKGEIGSSAFSYSTVLKV